MVKVEIASRLALELNRSFNDHDIEGLSRLLCEDCVLEDHHPPPGGSFYRGKQEILEHWEKIFKEYPDIIVEIEALTGMGDKCILRWKKVLTKGAIPLRGVDIIHTMNEKVHLILTYAKG